MFSAGPMWDIWPKDSVRGNKSHNHRCEPDSNPQPGGLECSALTTAPWQGPCVFWYSHL